MIALLRVKRRMGRIPGTRLHSHGGWFSVIGVIDNAIAAGEKVRLLGGGSAMDARLNKGVVSRSTLA